MDQSEANNPTRRTEGEAPTSPIDSPVPQAPSEFAPSAARAHVPFMMPVQIAGYRIIRLIGAGGMGLVYEAEQEALQRRVALKLMQPGAVSNEALARFEAEARALARLRHPGIAQVFDTGVYRPDGHDASIVPFLSMELVVGSVTLQEFAERSDVDLETKLRVMIEVCGALEHAHDAGVVHRDLKPSNILVNPNQGEPAEDGSRIKIIDFGIAKLLGDGSRTITSHGQIVGTPSYMAPEQLGHGQVDNRSDVYSIGVILYQLCTGRLPLAVPRGLDRQNLERALFETTPALPRTLDRRLQGDLETIILKCLQKAPLERYQSIGELRADLEAFLSGDPIRATRIGRLELARRAIGRFSARQPLAAFAMCVGGALLISMFLVFPAISNWSGVARWYSNLVVKAAPAEGMLPSLRDVRVIAIDNETDFEAIATRQHVEGVSNGDIKSVRLLHAEVLKKLAASTPRAVAIDVMFLRPTPFDKPLLESIHELRNKGVGVVLASPSWSFSDEGEVAIAPEFAASAWSAPPTGGFVGEHWAMDLALVRPEKEIVPGFSLLGFAAWREPAAEVAIAIRDDIAEVRYFKPGTQRRATLRSPDRLRFSGLQHPDVADPARGIEIGDVIPATIVPLPIGALEDCTISMQKFFAMSDGDLQREFSGRLAVIGNASDAGGDIQESPKGLSVPGVWTNAATIQQLLREKMIDIPNTSVVWLVGAGLALVGACAGFWFSSTWRAIVLIGTLTLIAICVSVLMLRTGGIYWNPLPGIAAGWLGCGFALMVTHDRRRSTRGLLRSS
ncbi:MAG: protein kinase [Phycisphaeraceae bacterium]|nr:protein kinase [Phycisphaeraceae bacterium]